MGKKKRNPRSSSSSSISSYSAAASGGDVSPGHPSMADHRPAERCKPPDIKKPTASAMDRARSYWNSISADEKLGFLEVSVADLMDHYSSSNDPLASDCLAEAIPFTEANATWKCWACCLCDERFGDCDSHLQHTINAHLSSLLPRIQSALLKKVPATLFSGDWKPIDPPSAIRMLQDIVKVGSEQWPLSDDTERTQLLERIQNIFKMLLAYNCLSYNLLEDLLLYAKEEIRYLASGLTLPNCQLDDLPLYIRILDAPVLWVILNLLRGISQSCGFLRIGRYCGKKNSIVAANHVGQESEVLDVLERLVLLVNPPKLILGSHLFQQLFGFSPDGDIGFVTDADAMVSWLFSSSSSGEQLSAWKLARARTSQQSMEIVAMLAKEFKFLPIMYEAKREQLSNAKALVLAFEKEKAKEMEHAVNSVRRSLVVVLKARQEDLSGTESDAMLTAGSKFELDDIIKEAQASEASWSEQDVIMISNLHELDGCTEEAICIQELNMIDARIMQTLNSLQQLELKLGPASAFDYHTVLMPLVKSFLQLRMEDLVDKDARQRSDALLEEPEDDVQRNINKGADHQKQAQKRSNDKRKNRGSRKGHGQ